jgi:hypothetical protein
MYRKTTNLVPGTTLVLNFFYGSISGTKCSSKNKVYGPVQIPKYNFFDFFSSIFWGLCPGTKCEKVVIFGFSAGTKREKLNFYSSNILNSHAFGTGTKTPKIEENNSNKNFFMGFYTGTNTYFWTSNILELHLVPGTTFRNFFLKPS